MRDGYLRGALSRPATPSQVAALAAFVEAGGSVPDAAELVGIRPSTVKRHLADLRARSGFSTVELVYSGRAAGWLVVPSLEPERSGLHPDFTRASPFDDGAPNRKPRMRTKPKGTEVSIRSAAPVCAICGR
jgi:hypothetical protein